MEGLGSDILYKLKSVKLWLSICLTALFSYQLATGQISGEVYAQLMMWNILGYTGGNVASKFKRGE